MAKTSSSNQKEIEINNFGGFVPLWFLNSYPFYGNVNQCSDMVNIDITDPNVLTQGKGLSNLINGNEDTAHDGVVDTLIRSILNVVTASNITYAIGGNKLYQLSPTTVTKSTTFPHTIDKTGVTGEDGEDIVYYNSDLYYFYNHSGNAGDIGKYNGSTFDETWGSITANGAEPLQNAPHQAINGGDSCVYFANGKYVGVIDGTTLKASELDFWDDCQVVSLSWNLNRVIVAVNSPNITGSNFNQSFICYWDGASSSFEGDPIEINGRIGALYTKNGITFVWWQDSSASNGYNFGYVINGQIKGLYRCKGTLPLYYQVGEYNGFVMWVSDGLLYLWGAYDPNVAVNLSQYLTSRYTTAVGGIGSPFGDILIASKGQIDQDTHYSIDKNSGYTKNSSWKSKAFKMSGSNYIFQIDLIFVETEPLSAGARADFTLTYNKGKSTQTLSPIVYSTANTTRHKITDQSYQVEDFRLDISFANGSTTNPVKIRSIMISGHLVLSN